MNQNDERVEEITEEAFRTNKDNATAMLEEAHAIEESTLTPANRINLKILQDLLNTYIDQKIDRLNIQIKQGITDHADSLIETTVMFDAEIDLLRSNMSASAFYEPFVDMPHNISEATRSELEKTGAKTLREVLLPAFEKMNNFIKTVHK
ncbi:hypothetical protein LSAT2_030917 [Lamellibrachia satsuma]|nr:hypothetical protein LSAT2_030917 [Lamellibrachia satsuma]